MALLATQAHLPLDEDRDRAVGEREQQGKGRRVVEHEVGAERGGENRGQEREGGAYQVEIEEQDHRQRQQRGRQRAREDGPGGAARVAGEERLGGASGSGARRRRASRAASIAAGAPARASAAAGSTGSGGGRRRQSRQRFVAIWKSQVEKRRPGSKRRAAPTTRNHVSW